MSTSPEQQLWCAVIDRAMQDAAKQVAAMASDREGQRLSADARCWFIENARDYRIVCELADIDADQLRIRVLQRARIAQG